MTSFSQTIKLLLAGVLFMVLGSSMMAQDQVVGRITEATVEGPTPLPGATVYWVNTATGTTTDQDGFFTLKTVKLTNRLVISYVGFESDTLVIESPEVFLNIEMRPEQREGEVTVEGRAPGTTFGHAEAINTIKMSERELFKAACCNLSESFETNPSVDVSFTDAVSGTKQIRMLGLAGPNVMISQENMPGIRGLAANFGLTFLPGPWIQGIQVTKGAGSVANGYESIAGHINVELKKPQESEKIYLNGFLNPQGRSELNFNFTEVINNEWAMTTLSHANVSPFKFDVNNDDFLDLPVGYQLNLLNRWVYMDDAGWIGQFGFQVMKDDRRGGVLDFDPEIDRGGTDAYGLGIDTERVSFFAKLGYVFPRQEYKTFGIQVSGTDHRHRSYFGIRNYDGVQQSAYTNLIYQSIIGDTRHKFRTGLSFQYDFYDEQLMMEGGQDFDFLRAEYVPGAFFEYTYDHLEGFTVVAGLRADQHNLFGTLVTPRLHTRLALGSNTTLRTTAGRGYRVANIISENTAILATSRAISFQGLQSVHGYGYNPESAWNFGANLVQDFRLFYRYGTINLDYYHTRFDNRVVLDLDHNTQEALFYGLDGQSFSNTAQVEMIYEAGRRFEVRLAYRYLDVRTDFTTGLLENPLIPRHRSFINLDYETNNGWHFDLTTQWIGQQRLPDTSGNPEAFQRADYTPSYLLVNAQVRKQLGKGWEVYVGGENLNNFRQDDPIIAPDDPFGAYFDTSMVWAPILGRMYYAGFRYKVF